MNRCQEKLECLHSLQRRKFSMKLQYLSLIRYVLLWIACVCVCVCAYGCLRESVFCMFVVSVSYDLISMHNVTWQYWAASKNILMHVLLD